MEDPSTKQKEGPVKEEIVEEEKTQEKDEEKIEVKKEDESREEKGEKKEEKEEEKKEEKKEEKEVKEKKEGEKEGAPMDEDEEVIDEDMMDGLADDLEQKLNLTGGERTVDDELGPEMDKYFENFMEKLQGAAGEGGAEGGPAFGDVKKMMDNLLGEGGSGGALDGAFGEGTDDEAGLDKMTDALLGQFMQKDILYEPIQAARKELSQAIEKPETEEKDKEQMKSQIEAMDKILETFDKEPDNTEKLISLFEEVNKAGSFMEIISKYSPEHAPGMKGLEGLFGGMGPMGGMPGGDGQEECKLI